MSPEVTDSLVTISEWLAEKDRLLTELYGMPIRRDYLLEELLRAVAIELGRGKVRSLAWYQKLLVYQGSASSVRNAAHWMALLGVLVLRPATPGSRTVVVAASERLVQHFCVAEPLLWEKWRQMTRGN